MERIFVLVGNSKKDVCAYAFKKYPSLKDIKKCFCWLDENDEKNIVDCLEGRAKCFIVEETTYSIKEIEVK